MIKFNLHFKKMYVILSNGSESLMFSERFGVWRSLVARTTGGREVAGSNPVTPIKKV